VTGLPGRGLARGLLGALDWRVEGEVPTEKKFVCLATPHTSNWDGVLLLALTRSIGLPITWMIKSEWLRGPMGTVLRPLGALGIDRGASHHVVEHMVDELRRAERLVLVIPPEGTRKRADYWKSGFYYIALGADVPVIPGYLDYARKRAGFGPAMRMTGNVHADMDAIRAFYAEIHPEGHIPSQFGPIRLRDEDDPAKKSG
jgi:1-acyl-sn-glycerol-3-phosphate acyltransferase